MSRGGVTRNLQPPKRFESIMEVHAVCDAECRWMKGWEAGPSGGAQRRELEAALGWRSDEGSAPCGKLP